MGPGRFEWLWRLRFFNRYGMNIIERFCRRAQSVPGWLRCGRPWWRVFLVMLWTATL